MKISIITVNLDNREGLRKTAESIVNQTCKDFEWIVVDGGSTDGSRELIEQYGEHISWRCSEPDGGIFNAMNKGIHHAHGEYLIFLNSGDAFCDVNVLAEAAVRLCGKEMYIGDTQTVDGLDKVDLSSRDKVVHTLLKRGFRHQSIFYHRSVFQKTGYYREDLKTCADWIVNIQAVIFNDAEVENIPVAVSVIEPGGVSTRPEPVSEDMAKLAGEHVTLNHIFGFYLKYYHLIGRIKNNPWRRRLGLWYASVNKWI